MTGTVFTGKKVFFFIAGFFGVIIVANLIMAYLAYTTFPGVETHNAYRQGRDFNTVIQAQKARDESGWEFKIEHKSEDSGGAYLNTFSIYIKDKNNQPVQDLDVQGKLFRFSDHKLDQEVIFNEMKPGSYDATVQVANAGKWELRLTLQKSDGTEFSLRKPIHVK